MIINKNNNLISNIKFKTPPSSYISNFNSGLRKPTIIVSIGSPGDGKNYSLSQYAVRAFQFHDYESLFILSSSYSGNAQYYNQIGHIKEVFPEQYIHDLFKINSWINHICNWNRKRMDYWRNFYLKYDSFDSFINFTKIFINI